MLHLLQPIWLFAIAGIIVPVGIHFWNNKQGKVLAIGSIALLEKTSLKKARSRRISEWLLLLLRCLLLMLLAFLLAGPYWKKDPGAGKKGWVLVGVEPSGGEGRTMMDSLIKEGYVRRDLKDSSWWEAFASLDRQAPKGIPFYVFTDGRLRHFAGSRPVTERSVYWYVDTAKDSITRWVDKRWSVGGDSMRVATGASGPTGSTYGYQDMLRGVGDSVDTMTLRVVVYADSIDGQWVVAAIRAVQQLTRRNISVTNKKVQNAYAGMSASDWVFWLSSAPLPDVKAANVLLYEPGKVIPVDTWVRGMGVQVEKVTERSVRSDKLQPVWVDSYGDLLLGMEDTAGSRRYHFFSHFNPAWNGMVWSGDFPFYLQTLLFAGEGSDHDRRVIDPVQVLPAKGGVVRETRTDEASIDLAPAGWLLVWLLLLCERLMAFKRPKDGINV
ncbi:MAG: BatA domain-containing protein [Chitinophagaceae bacterium]|nr:BatA domain-containing protein [Chitinophagaceae bacterium]